MITKRSSRIIICGKGASGKDHLRKVLQGRGFFYATSYTTRPLRKGEIDGKDYFFLEESEFRSLIDQGFFYEYTLFNGWYYGTSKNQWNSEVDLFIMSPSGISKIHPADRKSSFVIFLDIPKEVRLERLKIRNMPGDSIERRLEEDEKDFNNFTDFDIKITDPNF